MNALVVLLAIASIAFAYEAPTLALYTPNALRHGTESPGISVDGKTLTVGSVMGGYIDEVNLATGALSTYVANPNGGADDETWLPDGTLVFNCLAEGKVKAKPLGGSVITIASGLTIFGPNGIAYSPSNKVYSGEYPSGTGLYEVDPTGVNPKKLVLNMTSGLNGFDFGSDGNIYGAMSIIDTLIKIDLTTKTQTVVSNNFIDIESVRWDATKTNMYALDTAFNTIYRVNPNTGAKTPVVVLNLEFAYTDNFRILNSHTFILSETVRNALIEVDINAGTQRYITPPSVLCLPMGIDFLGETMYIADFVSLKKYNPENGQVTIYARGGTQPAPDPNVSFGLFNIFVGATQTAISCNFDERVQIRQTSNNAVITQVSANWPYGVAITASDTILLVNDYGTSLNVFSGKNYGTVRSLFPTFPFNNLTGMALAQQTGFVYVADYIAGKIFSVNYNTGAFTTVAHGLEGPEGIDRFINAAGRDTLAVIETVSKTVALVDIQTGAITRIADSLPVGLIGSPVLPTPYTFSGIAVAPNFDIYVTGDLNDALVKISYANCD